jgi:hypothetical protein
VKRSAPIKRPEGYSDPAKLDWIRQQRCLVWSFYSTACRGSVVPHHVRVRGGKRDDRLTVPLCAIGHHTTGARSVHAMGRKAFERLHKLDLTREAVWYQAKYERETEGGSVG